MKTKCVMVLLLALFFFSLYPTFPANVEAQTEPDVFVGVHLGYGDVAEAKALIDRTSSCANFVLIGTSRIFYDQLKLTETFQYAYDNDMYFMSFAPSIPHSEEGPSPRDLWFAYANQTWGDRLVGFYAYDEPGGQILDGELLPLWKDEGMPSNSVEAAENFKDYLTWRVDLVRSRNLGYWNYPLFTADYGLYWFNYKGGYDGLFAEFVANYNRQLTVSLVRGAAQIQNRQWGILIGWKYDYSPYLASGEELFEDMVFAYDSG
ncbi:unnamed protein product, partial [marine sediment metagenome]